MAVPDKLGASDDRLAESELGLSLGPVGAGLNGRGRCGAGPRGRCRYDLVHVECLETRDHWELGCIHHLPAFFADFAATSLLTWTSPEAAASADHF